ncbi:MAG: phosphate acyltransferase PlsX [Myxococcota bacterium]|nr:phosphate acyltransferase PlsX [Myxococcota bacterium]
MSDRPNPSTSVSPVVIDGMGGDRAPAVIVEGALLAMEAGHGPLTLVGDEARIKAHLKDHRFDNQLLEVVHATEAIGMAESPMRAARTKRDSSMHRAYAEVIAGRGCAVVSAGNSGAFMATGLLTSRRIPGCERPAIAACIPTGARPTILTDVGAHVECRAAHLAQFAIMGATYAALKFDQPRPTVALLANGTETTKGTDRLREAHRMLTQTDLNYLGFIESRTLPEGRVDVVVTDGFTGNVVLKLCEGLVQTMMGRIRDVVQAHWASAIVGPILKGPLGGLAHQLDWETIGAAPLLGMNHIALVAHGNASAQAIANAVVRAREYAELDLQRAIGEALKLQSPGEAMTTTELPLSRTTDEFSELD